MKQALMELIEKGFNSLYPHSIVLVRSRGKGQVRVTIQGGVNWVRSFSLHSREGTAMVFKLEDPRHDVFVSIPYKRVSS